MRATLDQSQNQLSRRQHLPEAKSCVLAVIHRLAEALTPIATWQTPQELYTINGSAFMATPALLDDVTESQPYPYATPEQPKKLSDQDLKFLSLYTGERDLDKLRAHVFAIWRSVKDTVGFNSSHRRIRTLTTGISQSSCPTSVLSTRK